MTVADLSLGTHRRPDPIELNLGAFTVSVFAPGANLEEVRAVCLQHREQLDARLRRSGTPAGPGETEGLPRGVRLAVEAAARCGIPVSEAAAGGFVQAVAEDLARRLGEAAVGSRGAWFLASPRLPAVPLIGGGRAMSLHVEGGGPIGAFASGERAAPLPGKADAIGVVAETAALAEAAAVSAAGEISRLADVPRALAALQAMPEVRGGVIVAGPAVAVFGSIRIEGAEPL